MALTADHYQALVNAGLLDFLKDNHEEFLDKAQRAYTYTRNYVVAEGLTVRIDDVAETLYPALKVSETLRHYLAKEKLKQQYWVTWFRDLVLDQLWEDLADESDE